MATPGPATVKAAGGAMGGMRGSACPIKFKALALAQQSEGSE